MAEKKIKWTEQQLRAIVARGSDVFVTASAGTGKTAVLSGRCVDIVSDKTICPDVWSILVLTFTEAAAEQMRSRIAEKLRDAFLKSGDPRLRCQLMLLQGADISTIHSFCKRLITEHFYKLGLDPTFRVIEGDEQRLLKAEVLEKTIEWAWEQSSLVQGLQQLFYRRDLRTTDGFLARIIELSDFLDSVVSRQNWCERATLLAGAANPFAGKLGEKQKQIVADKLQHIFDQLQHAKKLYENQAPGGDWAAECEDTFIKPVAQCSELLGAGDWDKFSREIRSFKKPTVRKPKGLSEPADELIRSTVKKAMDAFEKLTDLASLNPDYLDKVGGAAGLQTKVLVELVKEFDQLYSRAKRVINCLDFADLEHYALRLLTDETSSADEDNLSASETALALRRKYKYIFVDEYQDINPVQQAILDALSCGGNVFVVGDVKQSIYAWRGAEPDIFLEHLKQASLEPANAPRGLRVDLNANFRSAKGILDFVNKVFARIMTASFAGIDYDESAKLKPAFAHEGRETKDQGRTHPVVEFHILGEQARDTNLQNHETSEAGDDENLNVISSRQRQAGMIAQRIRQMVGAETGKTEFQIYDKQEDKFRDVEYRDIVILMRSLAKKADFVEVLRLAGVPVSCQAIAGYFEATEISDLLCLLKILDNPVRDIELAAVLRSPFFKISDTELAKIKSVGKADRHRNFYDCVLQYCDSGPDAKLVDKLKKILEQIQQWRTLARRGNLADLVWQIYRETGFLSFVSALPNGRARRANLLKLHDRAIQFEGFASSAGIAQLSRFVEFIEKLQEVGQDWAPAEPDSSVENAVRVLSVHKSKGLEFPVVFLAELDSKFNKRDIQNECLVDARYTLGLQIIDRQSNSKLSSLTHQVIAEQKLSTTLAEEMRILYVATTRARDRLILTACQKSKNCRDIICNGFFFGAKSISHWQLRTCQSPLEWLLYGLCDQKNLHNAFETPLAAQAREDELFSIKLYDQRQLHQLSSYVLKLKTNKSRQTRPAAKKTQPKRTDGQLLSQVKGSPKRSFSRLGALKKSLAWQYCFDDVPVLPAKSSVTQLTHRNDEYVKMDYSRALQRQPGVLLPADSDLAGPVESRLIGVATHLVIAQLDLSRPVNKEAIGKIKEKLLVDGAITEAIAKHINTKSIIMFFQGELGRTVLDDENVVWREWPFTFALPACEFSDSSDERQATSPVRNSTMGTDNITEKGKISNGTSDELIIVQGIIDMLARTPKGLVVIDFKTDHIAADQVPERAEFYRRQLELYSRAASAILKAEILAKWLYFLTPGCASKVE